jgi:hypothetical protein
MGKGPLPKAFYSQTDAKVNCDFKNLKFTLK